MGFQSLVQPSVVPQLIISLGNTPAATLVVLLIIAVMTWIAYVSYFSPLSSVPGPFLARFSRAWIMKHSRDGDMHRIMIDLHRRAGKLVRIGPNELLVAQKIISSSQSTPFHSAKVLLQECIRPCSHRADLR